MGCGVRTFHAGPVSGAAIKRACSLAANSRILRRTWGLLEGADVKQGFIVQAWLFYGWWQGLNNPVLRNPADCR